MDKTITNISPSFSVLMSVYFKETPSFFRASLESIWHKQTLRPSEIIIVKDGPLSVALEKVIEDFSKIAPIKTISLNKNKGLGIALAKGITHCTYDIVARMDSDDIGMPTRFVEQITFLDKNPEIDLVGSWVAEFEATPDKIKSIRKVPQYTKEIEKYAKHRNPINHPSVVFRKQAVLNAGNYIPFESMEDYCLWIRMLKRGSKMYNIQRSLLFFRSSNLMLKRRHGRSYYYKELKFQKWLLKNNAISYLDFFINYMIRLLPRLLPIPVLKQLYRFVR